MQQNQVLLLCLCATVFLGMGLVVYFGHRYSLNRIKSKVVGDGQHGTARWRPNRRSIRRISGYSIHPINGEKERTGRKYKD